MNCKTLCFALLAFIQASSGAERFAAEGPFQVETARVSWHDAKRNRDVPATIYYPAGATSACPIILFSHGLGGTRDTYAYLGRHWASHGYVSAHVQHAGSDDAVWRGSPERMKSMRGAAADPRNAFNRPLDISFALDEMSRTNGLPSNARIICDFTRVGAAGHSFGAWTTLAIAGQRIGPMQHSFADSRVRAAIAMSAPVPKGAQQRNYSAIKIPVLHMTGTADESPIGDTTARDRRVPFDLMTNSPECLVTFDGGDHMLFSGRVNTPKSKEMIEVVKAATVAFWDFHLKGDFEAKAWLLDGGLKKAVSPVGALEIK